MTSRLFVVWNTDHATYVQANHCPKDVVISFGLDASSVLQDRQIPCEEVTRFITLSEINRLEAEAKRLSQTWFRSIEGDCQFGDVNPLTIGPQVLYNFFHTGLCAHLIFSRILDRYAVDKVVVFQYAHRLITYTDMHDAGMTPILQYLAEGRGLPVEMISVGSNTQAHTARSVFRQLRVVLNVLKNFVAWQRLILQLANTAGSTACIVLAVSEGHRYATIVDDLRRLMGNRLLACVVGARSTGGLKVPGYGWQYRSLGLVPSLTYLRLRRQARGWYARWQEFQKAYDGDLPHLMANSHFDFQFRLYFREHLPNSLQTYMEARLLFKRLRTSVVVCTSLHSLHLAAVFAAATSMGLSVVTVPHSGIPTEPNITVLGDVNAVWTRDYLDAWSNSESDSHLKVVGLPTSVISKGYLTSRSTEGRPTQRKRITLLLGTAQIGGLPAVHIEDHQRALQTITTIPRHLADRVELVIKLHPVHDYEHYYSTLSPADGDSIRIVRDASIEDVLASSDLAVMVNMNTSAHLLALATSVPLIYIHNAEFRLSRYYRLDDWGRDFTITTDTAIWPALEAALFDPEKRQDILNANRSYWARLEAEQHDAIALLQQLIELRLS